MTESQTPRIEMTNEFDFINLIAVAKTTKELTANSTINIDSTDKLVEGCNLSDENFLSVLGYFGGSGAEKIIKELAGNDIYVVDNQDGTTSMVYDISSLKIYEEQRRLFYSDLSINEYLLYQIYNYTGFIMYDTFESGSEVTIDFIKEKELCQFLDIYYDHEKQESKTLNSIVANLINKGYLDLYDKDYGVIVKIKK